jgi:outer membrane protein assembly factor BamB
MIPSRCQVIRLLCLSLLLPASTACWAADEWPQFRGPKGDGQSESRGMPLQLGEGENVRWKTPIPGKGWSSPVISGNRIWLTTSKEDGTELSVVCVDRETGKILQDEVLFQVANPQFCHKFNSYASPTPVIAGGKVYVSFGSPGTACLEESTGKKLWERTDFVCNHYRGAGSSPIIWGELFIMNFDGSDAQYVVGLDKNTGKTVWRTDRSVDFQDLDAHGKPGGEGDYRKAFATPTIVEWEGKPQLISSGAKAHYAYDPTNGRELWRLEERGQHSASTRPLVSNGVAFIQTGFGKPQLLAVRLGGGGVLEESQIDWRVKKGVPSKPSILLINGLLFMVDDSGIANCVDAKTGEVIWTQRIGGNFSASPVYVDGRIYTFNEEGKVAVIAPEREFKLLGEGKFEDGFMASPAIAGNALFLRTKTALYRIEAPGK